MGVDTSNYVNQYALWVRDVGAQTTPTTSRSFTLKAKVRVPTVEVTYTPDMVEVLKNAWIQVGKIDETIHIY